MEAVPSSLPHQILHSATIYVYIYVNIYIYIIRLNIYIYILYHIPMDPAVVLGKYEWVLIWGLSTFQEVFGSIAYLYVSIIYI